MDEEYETDLEKRLAKYGKSAAARDMDHYLKMLLYGYHKSGKTIAACRIGKKQLLMAADNGWSSVKDYEELGQVEVIEMRNHQHFSLMSQAIRDDVKLYREFDHVIVDPLSKLVDKYIDYLQDSFDPDKRGDNRTTYGPRAGVTDQAFTIPGMTDYGAARNYFRKPVYMLIEAHRDVTIITHVREPGFTDTSKVLRPSVPGKIHEMLGREVNIIAYMEVENGNRFISTSPSNKRDAGTWIRKLNNKRIPAEEFPDLIAKWKEGTL